ncbi:MAG: DNA repair exonuclease, partial [Shinella sp.]|nr:DNA repair exonuclease [Shinella sp.]
MFERLSVDLSGIDDWSGMLDCTDAVLAKAREAANGAHLVARLAMTGATPLAWRLRRDEDLLLGEVQNIAASLGECWIEAVELAVSAPLVEAGIDAGP